MAASSTTRRSTNPGKGDGWGGPSKGSDAERKPMAAQFEPGNQVAKLPKNERRAARLEQLEEVLDRVHHLSLNADTHTGQITASLGFAKLYMKPEAQTLELSGVDGAPIKQDLNIAVVFRKPSEG